MNPAWQKEMANHSSKDVREAEYWGEMFRDKEKQRDPATAERFYTEMKVRLMRKFGTITQAFREIDVSGDGSINFLEWDSMLHLMHLPLENRACRWIFTAASGGDKEIDLSEFKMMLLQPTIKKLKTFVRSYQKFHSRVNQHIHNFITQLHEANHDIRIAAIDRFQRKMKIPFCHSLYDKIVGIPSVKEQLQDVCIQNVVVERTAISEVAATLVGSPSFGNIGLLLECQVPFLVNLCARVGNYRGTTVSVVDLMSSLLLLSPDTDRRGKLGLLFNVFDSDYDMVLDYNQIRELFIRICLVKPLFEGNAIVKQEGGVAFQEQLSEQEGLRNYECVRWRLQRGGNKEDAVNWQELWAAIEDQPDVVTSLMPAVPLIRWALDAIAVQIQDTLPRSVTPQRTQRQVAALLSSHPTLGDAWPIGAGGKKSGPGRRISSSQGGRSGKMPSATRSVSQPQLGDMWFDSRRPQTSEFRKDLTEQFQRRLRRLGNQRLTELTEGFEDPSAFTSPRSSHLNDADALGSASDLSPSSSRPSTMHSDSRASLLPRLGRGTLSPKSSGSRGQRSTLQRVSTAPTLRPASGSVDVSSSQSESSSTRLPVMDSVSENQRVLKWGMEAANRHRLLVAAKIISDKEDIHGGHGPDLSRVDEFKYACNICGGYHALNPNSRVSCEPGHPREELEEECPCEHEQP